MITLYSMASCWTEDWLTIVNPVDFSQTVVKLLEKDTHLQTLGWNYRVMCWDEGWGIEVKDREGAVRKIGYYELMKCGITRGATIGAMLACEERKEQGHCYRGVKVGILANIYNGYGMDGYDGVNNNTVQYVIGENERLLMSLYWPGPDRSTFGLEPKERSGGTAERGVYGRPPLRWYAPPPPLMWYVPRRASDRGQIC